MFRNFVLLLLLVIVFLSGIIVGSDKDRAEVSNDDERVEQVEHVSDVLFSSDLENKDVLFIENNVIENEQLNSTDMIYNDGQIHTTQKVASFLEKGVKGFYEIVVEVLYQISSLFFD